MLAFIEMVSVSDFIYSIQANDVWASPMEESKLDPQSDHILELSAITKGREKFFVEGQIAIEESGSYIEKSGDIEIVSISDLVYSIVGEAMESSPMEESNLQSGHI